MSFLRIAAAALLFALPVTAHAADRAKVEAFLSVTGFDVALESLRIGANSAPQMIGLEAEDFGVQWSRLADQVFETEGLHEDAIMILTHTLKPEVLSHAAAFYASDLGQRLVAAENESHLAADEDKDPIGEAILAELLEEGSPRVAYFQQMTDNIGTMESSVRSVVEVQARFLTAATHAGLIELRMPEKELRGFLMQNVNDMRDSMHHNMLVGSAFTYRDFTDADLIAYRDALGTPEMKEVYELMNAVQFELMADRYEKLAAELADIGLQQDL